MKEMIRISFLRRLFFVVLILVLLFLFNSCDTNSKIDNTGQVSPIEYKTIVVYFLDGTIDTVNCIKWHHIDNGTVYLYDNAGDINKMYCYVKKVKEL
jgi:hypothetical protein